MGVGSTLGEPSYAPPKCPAGSARDRPSRTKPLTNNQIAALPDGEHAVVQVPGLVIRVRGTSRVFALRYRLPGGRKRILTLGLSSARAIPRRCVGSREPRPPRGS